MQKRTDYNQNQPFTRLKQRSYFTDPAFLAIIAMNVYLVITYYRDPNSIHAIILFFWIQNVLIGLFHFLDMLTVQHTREGSFPIGNSGKNAKGCSALFFLVHYSAFQVGYLIFVVMHIDMKQVNWHYVYISFWLLLAGMFMQFIINKRREEGIEMNITSMIFLPYLRIIPMHLMIFVPALLHLSSYLVFLLLKAGCDAGMYIISNRMINKQVT
jgi:hypothetical protein